MIEILRINFIIDSFLEGLWYIWLQLFGIVFNLSPFKIKSLNQLFFEVVKFSNFYIFRWRLIYNFNFRNFNNTINIAKEIKIDGYQRETKNKLTWILTISNQKNTIHLPSCCSFLHELHRIQVFYSLIAVQISVTYVN